MADQKWIAVLAPDGPTALRDMKKRVDQADSFGLKPKYSFEHGILDLPGRRLQWVLPGHGKAVGGARFNEWFPVEGYDPDTDLRTDVREIVSLLKRSVFLANLGGRR